MRLNLHNQPGLSEIQCRPWHAVAIEPKSPAAVSAKREYLRSQLETFGRLTAGDAKKGVWRRRPNRKNPAVCGPFARSEVVISVRRSGWLTWEDSNFDIPISKDAFE